MVQQSKAKIFLSADRGLNENKHFRSLHTFNFGNYFSEHKSSFKDLYVLNDDTLDGGQSLSTLVQQSSYIILLPVVGAINYKDSNGNEDLVAAGQVHVINADKGLAISISNPFKEHLVNFVQLWIKAGAVEVPNTAFIHSYEINEQLNKLVNISLRDINKPVFPFIVSIGKFDGRGETSYQLQYQQSGLFVFVLEGAFEVEGRLLHARDGLALWGTTLIEMEALSNDAILLLVETNIVPNQLQ